MKKLILFLGLIFINSCSSQPTPPGTNNLGLGVYNNNYRVDENNQNVRQTAWLNIESFGAIGDAKKTNADANTQAIKDCIAFINSRREHGVIYIPSGLFWVNPIENADLRYVSFQGDGIRKSILKLNDFQNKPILYSNIWFECYIRDIQFDGNFQKNPDSEAVIHLESSNVYAMYFDNVYVSYYSNKGLLIDNGQLFNLNNIQAKYGSENGDGIYLRECLNVTINSPDCERNGKTGITIESKAANSYRRHNPSIYIRNPYLERNAVGVNLKGVCRVSIEAGYNSGGVFAKIENNGDAYSHFNNIIGKPSGVVIIEKGNYGNYISNNKGGTGGIIDNDGRNTSRLYNWDYMSRNFNGENAFPKTSTNPADYTPESVKLETEVLSIDSISFLGSNGVLNNLTDEACVKFKSTLSNTGNSLFFNPSAETWKPNTIYYFYLLAETDVNSFMELRVYDLKNRQFLNWNTWEFQDSSDSFSTQAEIPNFGGGVQGYQIPIKTDGLTDRNLRMQLSVRSVDSVDSNTKVYYIMVSETKDLGMLHYRNGIKIGEGL